MTRPISLPDNTVQIRLCGTFEDVEAITRDVRRELTALGEEDFDDGGLFTRFLLVRLEGVNDE